MGDIENLQKKIIPVEPGQTVKASKYPSCEGAILSMLTAVLKIVLFR